MAPAVLEPPVIHQETSSTTPFTLAPDFHLDCEERKASAPDTPANWISRVILKSYLSSFNMCLSELGWVPRSILEVGAGDGTLLSYVGQEFVDAEIKGVDVDAEKVAVAQEKNCCRIEFTELVEGESLPFADNQFDLVISHGFLGHSALPRHWMKEIARVSAEGVIMSVPTPIGYKWLQKFPGTQKAMLIGNPVFNDSIEPVSMNTLKGWIERSGLKVESTYAPIPYGMVLARKGTKTSPR
jgi:ubiquinone/menaquinone biosynthesis C-methylase UbiE